MWSFSVVEAAEATQDAQILAAEHNKQRENLQRTLNEHPDVMLDFLRQHSEALLEILQEGAVLRRNKAIVNAWENDRTIPKNINVSGRAMRGDSNAPVTVVAYSDFTCPYCEQSAAQMARFLMTYDGKIRYVFKNFPLESQGISKLAAEYYIAAGLQNQDQAWEFYDMLFANRNVLLQEGETFLKQAAKDVGLNIKRLNSDLKGKTVRDLMDEDLAEAARLGVDGTPTFFVNDLVVRGAVPTELFAQAIEMALDTAEQGLLPIQ